MWQSLCEPVLMRHLKMVQQCAVLGLVYWVLVGGECHLCSRPCTCFSNSSLLSSLLSTPLPSGIACSLPHPTSLCHFAWHRYMDKASLKLRKYNYQMPHGLPERCNSRGNTR